MHQAGQLEQALAAYQSLYQQAPDHLGLIQLIALTLTQLQQYHKAAHFVTQAITRDPDEASLHNTLGNIVSRQGNHKEAIAHYQKAVTLQPDYPSAYTNLGNSYAQRQDIKTAKQQYEKALRIDPDYPDASFNLARLLVATGHTKEAINALEHTLRVAPTHAAAHGLLGKIYLEQNMNDKAAQHLEQRIQIQPQHIETYLPLACAYMQLQQHAKAQELLEHILDRGMMVPEANYMLGMLYLMQNHWAWALKHFLREIQVTPTHEDSHYHAGVTLTHMQRNSDAIEYFLKTIELNKTHSAALINLGALSLKEEQPENAIMYYQRALTQDPENKEIQHILHGLLQDANPDNAPVEYIQHLFDQYAPHYEQHLNTALAYHVPEALFKQLTEAINQDNLSLNILDLGCGTGLCSEHFHAIANTMVGIDLSEKMLAICRQKNRYTQLIHGPINTTYETIKNIDLVIAADVFPYIGDLDGIFKSASYYLNDGGYFCASIEALKSDSKTPYRLAHTIRYQHKKSYIEQLAHTHKFTIIDIINFNLRKNHEKPVEGYLFLLKK